MGSPDLMDGLVHKITALLTREPRSPERIWREEELQSQFASLCEPGDAVSAAEVEGTIWEIWCDHSEEEARGAIESVVDSIVRRRLGQAERMADVLVRDWPDWAEAWNKRATLYFLLGRDAESLADIQKTLELEPRHFGALCGLAQICMRMGDEGTAAFALDRALTLNPHLPGVKETLSTIKASATRKVH
ncbi:MAG: hypothetical protein K0U93_21610 [Gammaproteobacteria bacterium]|nr:hypothetical protein [Gammaproteobacteria bacterium]